MKGLQIYTTYLLGPILIFLLIYYNTVVQLINDVYEINNKIIAFSACSRNMIDYAFIGKVYNLTECYLNYTKHIKGEICKKTSNRLICKINNKTYILPIPKI